jgi:hypothetical protein
MATLRGASRLSSRPKSLTDTGRRPLAALHEDRIDAPWLLGFLTVQSMARPFRTYVERALALTLRPRDIVVTYNHGSHKSAAVRRLIAQLAQSYSSCQKSSPASTQSSRSSQSSCIYCGRRLRAPLKPSIAIGEPLSSFYCSRMFQITSETGTVYLCKSL